MRYSLLIKVISCLFLSLNLAAQSDPNDGNFMFFSTKLHAGKHLYTGEILADKLKNGYAAIELRLGWQSKGKQAWQRQCNYPSYGFGWYSGYVGDVDIFGSPHALFGFITFPITKDKRNTFQVEPALGLTYNLKPYNPENNPINDAIGSKMAVYFALHGGGNYKLTRELDILYGADITHFSNGRMVAPNLGLNMLGLSTGVRYNFNSKQAKVDNRLHPTSILEARPTLAEAERPTRIIEDNISFYQAFGIVQNRVDAGTNHKYMTSSSVFEYQHKFNTKHGVSIGFDAFYDPSARDTTEFTKNKEEMEVFFPGIHIGYDFMFWRMAFRMQYGFNLTPIGRELKGNTYFRAAVQYNFNKKLFGQLGLKSMNGTKADWVEWGLGYKFFYTQRKPR